MNLNKPNTMSFPTEGIRTERLVLRAVNASDAPALLDYQQRNRAHLQPWEPLRVELFYIIEAVQERVAHMMRQMTAPHHGKLSTRK